MKNSLEFSYHFERISLQYSRVRKKNEENVCLDTSIVYISRICNSLFIGLCPNLLVSFLLLRAAFQTLENSNKMRALLLFVSFCSISLSFGDSPKGRSSLFDICFQLHLSELDHGNLEQLSIHYHFNCIM